MKRDLASLAMLALLASFCLSANAPFSGKEIAMSKCSKESTAESRPSNSKCNGRSDCGDDDGYDCRSCDSCSDQSDASSLMKAKEKALSEKIVQADK